MGDDTVPSSDTRVWAKLKGYSWWPAVAPADWRSAKPHESVKVSFFEPHAEARVGKEYLREFLPNLERYRQDNCALAIEEALSYRVDAESQSDSGPFYVVESVVQFRYNTNTKQEEFWVKWEGYNGWTWEPASQLRLDIPEMLSDFLNGLKVKEILRHRRSKEGVEYDIQWEGPAVSGWYPEATLAGMQSQKEAVRYYWRQAVEVTQEKGRQGILLVHWEHADGGTWEAAEKVEELRPDLLEAFRKRQRQQRERILSQSQSGEDVQRVSTPLLFQLMPYVVPELRDLEELHDVLRAQIAWRKAPSRKLYEKLLKTLRQSKSLAVSRRVFRILCDLLEFPPARARHVWRPVKATESAAHQEQDWSGFTTCLNRVVRGPYQPGSSLLRHETLVEWHRSALELAYWTRVLNTDFETRREAKADLAASEFWVLLGGTTKKPPDSDRVKQIVNGCYRIIECVVDSTDHGPSNAANFPRGAYFVDACVEAEQHCMDSVQSLLFLLFDAVDALREQDLRELVISPLLGAFRNKSIRTQERILEVCVHPRRVYFLQAVLRDRLSNDTINHPMDVLREGLLGEGERSGHPSPCVSAASQIVASTMSLGPCEPQQCHTRPDPSSSTEVRLVRQCSSKRGGNHVADTVASSYREVRSGMKRLREEGSDMSAQARARLEWAEGSLGVLERTVLSTTEGTSG